MSLFMLIHHYRISQSGMFTFMFLKFDGNLFLLARITQNFAICIVSGKSNPIGSNMLIAKARRSHGLH